MQQDSADLSALIRSAQAGDEASFSLLIEQHYDQMYRFALKFIGRTTEAEDVTQQACLKLARSLQQFRFESAFSTWLYRLVINCAKDWLRQTPKAANDEDAAELPDAEVSDASVNIHLSQVLDLLESLGEGFRETVLLVLGEGLSHKEAAVVLGVEESTISWRLHKARKKLGEQP